MLVRVQPVVLEPNPHKGVQVSSMELTEEGKRDIEKVLVYAYRYCDSNPSDLTDRDAVSRAYDILLGPLIPATTMRQNEGKKNV